MNTKLFLVIVGLLFAVKPAAATDSLKTKSLTYSIGYSNFRILDRQATPVVYSSASLPLQVGFRRHTGRNMFNACLSLVPGLMHNTRYKSRSFTLVTKDNDGNAEEMKLDFMYLPIGMADVTTDYSIRIGSFFNNRLEWLAGGQLQEFLVYSISVAPFYLNQFALKPITYVTYAKNDKYTINASFSFSLLSFVTRLPYSMDLYSDVDNQPVTFFKQGTVFEAPNHYQRFDFSLAGQAKINERWSGALQYRFFWYHHSEKMGLWAYNNGVSIQFTRAIIKKVKQK